MKNKLALMLFSLIFIVFYFCFTKYDKNQVNQPNRYENFISIKYSNDDYKQNSKRNVTALVFYGRKRYMEILSKYLISNLKINGGVLDQVKFAVKTNNQTDLEYLNELIEKYPKQFLRYNFTVQDRFTLFYKILDDDEYVFKIDDDVVFIQKGALKEMLKEYKENNHMFLSANVVNHPRLSDLHARLGAIKPLCQFNKNCNENSNVEFIKFLKECSKPSVDFASTSMWWKNPDCSMLAHRNFFHNFYTENLKSYNFELFNFHYDEYSRYSINFVLSMGKYLNKLDDTNFPDVGQSDDELKLSSVIPKMLNKPSYSLGSALVCHFAYFTQRSTLDSKKEFLDTYKDISNIYLGF